MSVREGTVIYATAVFVQKPLPRRRDPTRPPRRIAMPPDLKVAVGIVTHRSFSTAAATTAVCLFVCLFVRSFVRSFILMIIASISGVRLFLFISFLHFSLFSSASEEMADAMIGVMISLRGSGSKSGTDTRKVK